MQIYSPNYIVYRLLYLNEPNILGSIIARKLFEESTLTKYDHRREKEAEDHSLKHLNEPFVVISSFCCSSILYTPTSALNSPTIDTGSVPHESEQEEDNGSAEDSDESDT